jgi:phospholipid-binding lipoprotein MlaA
MNISSRFAVVATLIAGLGLAACASEPTDPSARAEFQATNDPFEPTNRFIFDLNDFLDRLLIAPLAGLYQVTVPPPLRDRLANIVGNMSEPVVLANNLMQGEFGKAETTTERFLTNTLLGVGGTFEVANDFGLLRQQGDFGQTLSVWGFGEGPYMVLPLFGPSNLRDAIGLGVDTVLSPWKYAVANGGSQARTVFSYTDLGVNALVRREAVLDAYDSLKEGSLDFYAQMRSIYRQHRAKELGQPAPEGTPTFEDYDNEQPTAVFH